MAKVFVSHASEDDRTAGLVHGWLLEDGHEAFLDHDLRDGIGLGEEWEPRLHDRLRWADAVVCLITSAYLGSAWCAAELGVARSRGSRLLPISAEPALTHPLLPALQYTELLPDPAAARTALREALRRIDGTVGWGWPGGRSPYPGLAAFDGDRHRVFFGRRREVTEIAELLRSPAEEARGAALFLVGPSGCGKSSLVRAGVLPLLAGEPGWWCLPPIVPGPDPVAALSAALAAEAGRVGLSARTARAAIESGHLETAVEDLLEAGGHRRLLVLVDQFEELLTHGDQAGRRRFAELLRPALGRSVRLVATLRPEFLAPLLAAPELELLPKRVHPVEPLRRSDLRSVITAPARLAGLTVDDELVERLVADTGDGQALPLLAFTLAELSAELRRGDRLLTSRYEQLDGVAGALAKQAGAAMAEARAVAGRSEDEVLRELLRLVTVDEQDRPVRLRVPLDELPGSTFTELGPFVDRRLLTTHAEHDRAVIGVVHEAFLTAWPPLRAAIERTAAGLRARAGVDQAARQWEQQGRPKTRLWVRGQLAAALTDTGARLRRSELVSNRVELAPPARAFLRASIRHDRWLRRRAVTVLAALLVLALIAAGYAFDRQQFAEGQQLVATARQLVAQADAARATDPRAALRLGIAAQRLAPGPANESGLVDTLTHTSYIRTLEHDSDVVSVAVAPDGRTLASGSIDGTIRLWHITDPGRARPTGPALPGHRGYLYSVAYAPDGRTLASAGADGTVIFWNVSDQARAQRIGEPLPAHPGGVHAAVFAPRSPLLATAGFDDTVQLWDVNDPARPRRLGPPLTGHTDVVSAVAFTPDGLTMATAGFDASVRLWDVSDSAIPRPLGGPLIQHTSAVWSVEFAPDGRTLASGSVDGTVSLWDVSTPAQSRGFAPMRANGGGQVFAVAFAPVGHTLAAAGSDKAVTVWDVTDPAAPGRTAELVGHTNNVYSVAFTPDARTLIGAGADRVATLWNLAGPPQPRPIGAAPAEPGPGLHALALAPDGQTVATGGATGQVDLWDIGGTRLPRHRGMSIAGHTGVVWSVAFSADGRTLVSGGADGTVRIQNTADRDGPRPAAEVLTDLGGPIFAVAVSPDGRTLAAAGADERIRLWDLTDPTRPRPIGEPLTGHTGAIYTLAFAPNGHTLVSGAADTAVIAWDVADPARPRMLGAPLIGHTGPVYSVAFPGRGDRLASASGDGSVVLWDLADRGRARPLGRPLLGHSGAVYRVAYAADGRTLVTGGADNTAVLWDLTDPDRPRRLGPPMSAHTGPVNGVQLILSGLATAGGDGRLVLWDLAELDQVRERPLDAACAVAARGLDQQEWASYLPGLPYRDTCGA